MYAGSLSSSDFTPAWYKTKRKERRSWYNLIITTRISQKNLKMKGWLAALLAISLELMASVNYARDFKMFACRLIILQKSKQVK